MKVTKESLFTIKQNNGFDLRDINSLQEVINVVQTTFQNVIKYYKEDRGFDISVIMQIVNVDKASLGISIKYSCAACKTMEIKPFLSYLNNAFLTLSEKKQEGLTKVELALLTGIEKLQKIGLQEIACEVDDKSTTWFIENQSFQKEKNVSDKISNGLRHLHTIMCEINDIIKKTEANNTLYRNRKFIFRGITKFYPDNPDNQASNNLNQEIDKVRKDNIKSSLAVRLGDTSRDYLKDYNYTRAFYVNALEDIIRKAKNMYPNKYMADMSDLDILADIQHNGGATCLVDFSKNLLTSIWFACNADLHDNGYLYCYNIMEDMIDRDALTVIRPEDENRSISELIAQTYRETNVCSDVETRFCLWEPAKRNNRMLRQDSVFVFGIEKFKVEDHAIKVIQIKAEWKSDILTAMKAIFNISGSSVYNDHIGFANNMNKLRPYRKMLDSVYTRGYTNMIKGHYASALDFLKLAEIECLKKEWNKKEQLELHFSLGVCYKSLARQNEKIRYLENAISEYDKVIILAKEILAEDMEKDSDAYKYYHHKMIRAYNAIVTLYYKLERYCDAICKCKEIIGVIEEWESNHTETFRKPTSKYCKISIWELWGLALIQNHKEALKLSNELNGEDVKECFSSQENVKDFDFFVLLEMYYKTVVHIISNVVHNSNYNVCEAKKVIRKLILLWHEQVNVYFKSFELKDEEFILWNFTDMKNAIDTIKKNHFLYPYKTVLQDLTAEVISLRDQFEMNGWWSKGQL